MTLTINAFTPNAEKGSLFRVGQPTIVQVPTTATITRGTANAGFSQIEINDLATIVGTYDGTSYTAQTITL